jgi:hypothetical protein
MSDAGRIAARARRTAMTACVPSIEIEIGQIEFVDQMRHAPTVLVAAMKKHDDTTPLVAGQRR